jgi:hypothetical protein
VGNLLVRLPADLWVVSERIRPVQSAVGIAAVLVFGLLLREYWRDFDPRLKRALCWMIPGAAISILPVAAAFPSSRLLLLPSLGASVATGAILYHWRQERKAGKPGRLRNGFCWYLAALNLALPLVVWPAQSAIFGGLAQVSKQAYLNAEIDDANVAGQRLILLVSPDPLTCVYPVVVRAVEGHPAPKSFHALSMAPHPHRLTRTGPNRFELEVVNGAMLETEFERLFRSADYPIKQGHEIDLGWLKITVLETTASGPSKVEFAFDKPLEDPSLCFLMWKHKGLRKAALPTVGKVMELPRQRPFF